MKSLKTLTVGGLLALGLFAAGCEDRRQPEPRIRDGVHGAGEEVGEAARDVESGAKRAGEEVGKAAREVGREGERFIDGVKDGFGGSGEAGEPEADPRRTPPTVPNE